MSDFFTNDDIEIENNLSPEFGFNNKLLKAYVEWTQKQLDFVNENKKKFIFYSIKLEDCENELIRQIISEKGYYYKGGWRNTTEITFLENHKSFVSLVSLTPKIVDFKTILLELIGWGFFPEQFLSYERNIIVCKKMIQKKVIDAYELFNEKEFILNVADVVLTKIPDAYLEMYNKLPPDQQKSLMEALGVK